MAKAPQAGRSKTRLCPPLTREQAAGDERRFSARHGREHGRCRAPRAPSGPMPPMRPAGTEALLRECLAAETALLLADGRRRCPRACRGSAAACCMRSRGCSRPATRRRACSAPTARRIPTAYLVQAATILLAPGDRAVLGPADDGGYYLLGLKAPHAAMFRDIAWSTETVADETRARAREIGLDLVELAALVRCRRRGLAGRAAAGDGRLRRARKSKRGDGAARLWEKLGEATRLSAAE